MYIHDIVNNSDRQDIKNWTPSGCSQYLPAIKCKLSIFISCISIPSIFNALFVRTHTAVQCTVPPERGKTSTFYITPFFLFSNAKGIWLTQTSANSTKRAAPSWKPLNERLLSTKVILYIYIRSSGSRLRLSLLQRGVSPLDFLCQKYDSQAV